MSESDFVRGELRKALSVMQAMLDDAELLQAVEQAAKLGARAIHGGGKVMFCGNGGSAADSQHLAAELVGKLAIARPGMAGLALTVDSSALTAIGNDFGYEHVFARQVQALGRPGDLLVGISTSGGSRNVVAALQCARSLGMATVAMTGARRGPMAELADVWIPVPHTETQKIQEGHIVLGHTICGLIELDVHGATASA